MTELPTGIHRVGRPAIAAIFLLAVGCSKLADLPGVYRLDIRQGNAFEERRLARLELGMSREQVSELLGSPAIRDPFNPDRWDYVYTFAPEGRRAEGRKITLHFENEKLARIEGATGSDAARASEPRPARVVRVPSRPPDTGFLKRLLGRYSDE